MPEIAPESFTAFAGYRRIATGRLAEVVTGAKSAVDRGDAVLIFDNATSQQVEIDFRGTEADVIARLGFRSDVSASARRAGRPKLGVIGREVTLLPRHWDWLGKQPGGASVTLRRLIDMERKASSFNDLARSCAEATYRFMHATAGDFPHFEEATRALFAADRDAFVRLTDAWPVDVRDHARWLMTGGAISDIESEG
jgi:hypothetical protein